MISLCSAHIEKKMKIRLLRLLKGKILQTNQILRAKILKKVKRESEILLWPILSSLAMAVLWSEIQTLIDLN